MLKHIRNFLNGSVFGMTLIVPGVSATVLAIILGFYGELINTLNHFRKDYRKNARYLAVFLFGVAVGAVVFSSVIMHLLAYYSFPVMLFFMGLLAGTVPLITSKAKGEAPKMAPRNIVLALVSLAALFALSLGVNATPLNPEYAIYTMSVSLLLLVFLGGIINGATLVIPGLSGAFILLVMGLYPLIVYSISSVGDYVTNLGNFSLLRDIAMVLLPYGVGALIGCLAMARIMEKLMRYFHESVNAVILGLILGSLVTLVKNPLVSQSGSSTILFIIGAITFCAGFAAAYALGKKSLQ